MSHRKDTLNMDATMNGIKPAALCLAASLGTTALAAEQTELKLKMTQLIGKECSEISTNSNTILPGDCITYRIEVENISHNTAKDVVISALIPEHTELHTTFRQLSDHRNLASIIDINRKGQRVIKTTLDSLPTDQHNKVVLEYSVKVI
ncbi:hypothetical protein EOL70_13200 [Leucothrix sargassi]|nr:hypothetical protein EOL70_13200 [Leucothrix sargassi]